MIWSPHQIMGCHSTACIAKWFYRMCNHEIVNFMCPLLSCVLYMLCGINLKMPGYFVSREFINFLFVYREGSSVSLPSLLVESIYKFICHVSGLAEHFTLQSNNLICFNVVSKTDDCAHECKCTNTRAAVSGSFIWEHILLFAVPIF